MDERRMKMTNLYVTYERTVTDEMLAAAYGIKEYKASLTRGAEPTEFNVLMVEDGFNIVKLVDHTDLWIQQPKSGSLIEERYSAPKWEQTFRESVELFGKVNIYANNGNEPEEVEEEAKLPEIQKTYTIAKKDQRKFTEKYPEEKYRIKENTACVVINQPKHVKAPKLPKTWVVNPKYLKDVAARGMDSAVPFHINNFNTKYLVYMNPEDYTDQYGSQIRTKTKHTDKVEKWVKYLLRHKGLEIIFRTNKGDMHYTTKGGHVVWNTLNQELIEILEQLVMLQPTPKSLAQVAREYNSVSKECKTGTKEYVMDLLRELKTFSKEMSFEEALKLYVERHINKFQDVNAATVYDYSIYTNDYGFYIYENENTGQTVETLITNKYLEANGLLEERVDIDEMKERLEQMKDDIKGIYPICKDIGLALFKSYEALDAKLSREFGMEEACGYAEWLGVDEDENVEMTVLNHLDNKNYALNNVDYAIKLYGATVAKH
jgi:hypothetical protein